MNDRIEQIEARADAATEGPWVLDSIESGEHAIFAEEHHRLGCGSSQIAGFLTAANAAFLHAAREDVPYLLALVREQQSHLVAIEADIDGELQDAEPSNYEEDNYDAGYIAGLSYARLRAALTASQHGAGS